MSNISSLSSSPSLFPSSTGTSAPVPEPVSPGEKLTSSATNAGANSGVSTPKPALPNAQELQAAVSSIQAKVSAISPELQFSIDQTSGRSLIMVTDQSTRDVLWQFPSEAAIEISKALDLFQKGALLNRKA